MVVSWVFGLEIPDELIESVFSPFGLSDPLLLEGFEVQMEKHILSMKSKILKELDRGIIDCGLRSPSSSNWVRSKSRVTTIWMNSKRVLCQET